MIPFFLSSFIQRKLSWNNWSNNLLKWIQLSFLKLGMKVSKCQAASLGSRIISQSKPGIKISRYLSEVWSSFIMFSQSSLERRSDMVKQLVIKCCWYQVGQSSRLKLKMQLEEVRKSLRVSNILSIVGVYDIQRVSGFIIKKNQLLSLQDYMFSFYYQGYDGSLSIQVQSKHIEYYPRISYFRYEHNPYQSRACFTLIFSKGRYISSSSLSLAF